MRESRPRDWRDEPPERVRVLIECPPEASPSIIADVVERHGMAVRVCEGPDSGHRCDLITGGSCDLVTGADVVVNMLGQHREGGRRVADAVRAERRPPPVVIERSGVDQQHPAETPDTVDLHRPYGAAGLLDAIRRALAKGH